MTTSVYDLSCMYEMKRLLLLLLSLNESDNSTSVPISVNNSNALNTSTTNDFSAEGNWSFVVNSTNTTTTVIVVNQGPIANWEGYMMGLICFMIACGLVLAPAWYLDHRRHREFVGNERRRDERQRRRRQRVGRRRRRRLRTLSRQISRTTSGNPEERENYLPSMLVTKTVLQTTIGLDKLENSSNFFYIEESTDCCAICLQDYSIGDQICWSKNRLCQHHFHHDCLVPWLLKHNHCPCCRLDYLAEDNNANSDDCDDVSNDDLSESYEERAGGENEDVEDNISNGEGVSRENTGVEEFSDGEFSV